MTELLRFDGRVAIVTGAGSGMGREHAKLLAARGARVVINNLSAEKADSLVREIEEMGGTAVSVLGSVADNAAKIVTTAMERFGRIDIIINNAGTDITKPFTSFTESDLSQILDVYVLGSWRVTQLAWPHMQKAQYGRVIMVTSPTLFGFSHNAVTVTAEGALFGLTKALAAEGSRHGILVNCIAPTAFTTMVQELVSDSDVATRLHESYKPEAVSATCAWMVHEQCKIQGECLSTYGPTVGRVFLGETQGGRWEGGPYTPEAAQTLMDDAWDLKDFVIPKSLREGYSSLRHHDWEAIRVPLEAHEAMEDAMDKE